MIDILSWQKQPLSELIARGEKLPHALLIHGRSGVGKIEFARALAQSLLCESPQDGFACGECPACGWFREGNHPDFRELLPESMLDEASTDEVAADADDKDKKKSREIKIDQIRAIADFMMLSTHRDGYRVLLVHPAEAMNIAAANALLKTLEEPAARTVILLVSDQLGRLLATIRSRCQRVLVPAPDTQTALAWLNTQGMSNAGDALAAAAGAPLDAIAFGNADYQSARLAFVATLAEPDFDYVLSAQNFEKTDLPSLLGWMQTWTNDLIRQKMLGQINHHRDHARAVEKIARNIDLPKVFRFESELRQSRRLINHPLNTRLLLEQLFIAYKQAISSRPSA
ncbi:MAG: DNA polymerase III subunit delta' [Rhodocyclaceae bacterium]|nr:DNA polymerase III subunit delta' [Rhodocyclaceae bacterium]MCA3025403.1 DNA polymerase III subunit delta' [Rhodocyclaceae bacterium]MCA3027473.1 DNA polymerase III subunit delta' [Rhodocyclaceae bacterium]MCA3031621.1 DNA polymerase III subunit delta' [Rhodocyclaceae bacterium]MCA3038268.1 DNA polymerase III subunit delta' [Rhodocyclaceae bacterium]